MSQYYSDPTRAPDPHALPDLEVFFVSRNEFIDAKPGTWHWIRAVEVDGPAAALEGWYWWSCSPGCLPDSEPSGPFETEALALRDARDITGPDDDDRPEHEILDADRARWRRP